MNSPRKIYIVENDNLSDDWPVFDTREEAETWIRVTAKAVEFIGSPEEQEAARAQLIADAIAAVEVRNA